VRIILRLITGCEPCPSGYHGYHSQGLIMQTGIDHTFQRQRCDDIDECREGIARCGTNSQCVNTEGSYECTCSRGYARNETYGCLHVPGMCPDGTICDRNAVCQHAGGNRYRYANLTINGNFSVIFHVLTLTIKMQM